MFEKHVVSNEIKNKTTLKKIYPYLNDIIKIN